MKTIIINFWKIVAMAYDGRPRVYLPKHHDYPIVSADIAKDGKYDYRDFVGCKILYKWDEKGKHWVVFTRP